MIDYSFYNPTKLIFGELTISQIGGILKEYGCDNVLLVAGGGSIKKNGVYNKVVESLKKNDILWSEFWGIQANPLLSKVREGIEIARIKEAKAILAIGGGSVIDSGKAIAAGMYAKDVWNVFKRQEHIQKAASIFTILTLSATSSEMNSSAVLTNDEEKRKIACSSYLFYPKVSIIQPSIQNSLPWEQTVNGAVDAISHIMEYYFMSTEEKTAILIDESLLKSIIESVNKLFFKQDDTVARANLAWAITLALNGISGTGLKGGDWVSHEISHAINARYPNLSHGCLLGIIFPAWMESVYTENEEQFNRFSIEIFHCDNVKDGIHAFRKMLKIWSMPINLAQLGLAREVLKEIAETIISFRRNGKIGHFKALNVYDIEQILYRAYDVSIV